MKNRSRDSVASAFASLEPVDLPEEMSRPHTSTRRRDIQSRDQASLARARPQLKFFSGDLRLWLLINARSNDHLPQHYRTPQVSLKLPYSPPSLTSSESRLLNWR